MQKRLAAVCAVQKELETARRQAVPICAREQAAADEAVRAKKEVGSFKKATVTALRQAKFIKASSLVAVSVGSGSNVHVSTFIVYVFSTSTSKVIS